MTAPTPPLARSPRFWVSWLAVLAGAVGARLAGIQALAAEDVVRARAELAVLLRVGGALLFGLTTAVGVSIAASSRRALAEGRFPPSGIWSSGATRVATGPQAESLARVGQGLGALLVLLSLAAAALTWYLAAVLLACRAL